MADGVIQEMEAELLRAIADTLDCPIPPFIPANPARKECGEESRAVRMRSCWAVDNGKLEPESRNWVPR